MGVLVRSPKFQFVLFGSMALGAIAGSILGGYYLGKSSADSSSGSCNNTTPNLLAQPSGNSTVCNCPVTNSTSASNTTADSSSTDDTPEVFEGPWNNTAVFTIDRYLWYQNGQPVYEAATDRFHAYARSRGATIFHLCYGCYDPLVGNSTDETIKKALQHVPCLQTDEVRYNALFGWNRQQIGFWPFYVHRDNFTKLDAAKETVKMYEDYPEGTVIESQKYECLNASDFTNTMRTVVTPNRVGTTVFPEDVVTTDTALIARVLAYKNITRVIYTGVDGNECVLWSRPYSIANLNQRTGWDRMARLANGNRIYTIPELVHSQGFDIGGIPVDFTNSYIRDLWIQAVADRFDVHRIYGNVNTGVFHLP